MGQGLIIGFLIIGFVIAILWAVIDWGQLLRERFGNNPNKGRVYIESQEDIHPKDAKRTDITNKGEVFAYKWGGRKHQVVVPPGYPIKYIYGRRVIAIKDGKLVASALFGKDLSKLSETSIISIEERQAVVDLVLALTGKGMPKWIWILLGVGAAVVIFMAFRGCGGEAPPGQVPVSPETGEPFTSLLFLMGV